MKTQAEIEEAVKAVTRAAKECKPETEYKMRCVIDTLNWVLGKRGTIPIDQSVQAQRFLESILR